MGQWLATVRFPGGTVRFACYSTVVNALVSDLLSEVDRSGHRAMPAGEPLAVAGDSLLPVVITVEPDGVAWHALYDPARAALLGPTSSGHHYEVRRRFSRSADGHLTDSYGRRSESGHRAGEVRSVCGRAPASPLSEIDEYADLFASWTGGMVCRDCLVAVAPGFSS